MFTEDELREQLQQNISKVRAAGPRPDTQSFDYLFNEVIDLRKRIGRLRAFRPCNHDINDPDSTLEPIIKPRGTRGPLAWCTSCGVRLGG